MSRVVRLFAAIAMLAGALGWLTAGDNSAAAAGPALHYLYGSGSQTGGKNIKLRVQLTAPAPSGGTTVALLANSTAVHVPTKVHVSSGDTEAQVSVSTDAISVETDVTITATLGNISKSRIVRIHETAIRDVTVQRIIRHGGVGRVSFFFNGPARPAGGYGIGVSLSFYYCGFCGSDSPYDHFQIGQVVTVPAGQTSISFAVPAYIVLNETTVEGKLPDLQMELSVSDHHRSGTGIYDHDFIIRDLSGDPQPIATEQITEEASTSPSTTRPIHRRPPALLRRQRPRPKRPPPFRRIRQQPYPPRLHTRRQTPQR